MERRDETRWSKAYDIDRPNEADVVFCGRGRLAPTWPANRRYFELIERARPVWKQAACRQERTKISLQILAELTLEGRRFVLQVRYYLGLQTHVLTPRKAREKISKALADASFGTRWRNRMRPPPPPPQLVPLWRPTVQGTRHELEQLVQNAGFKLLLTEHLRTLRGSRGPSLKELVARLASLPQHLQESMIYGLLRELTSLWCR